MINQEVSRLFNLIADYLEMDDVPFKPAAYRIAAENIQNHDKDLNEMYKAGGVKALMEIPRVGINIANKIEEYIKTGKISTLERLKEKVPVDLEALTAIESLGPKRVKILYEKLGVRTVDDLKRVVQDHKVAALFGFGEKTENNLAVGLGLLKQQKGRFPLKDILPKAEQIVSELKKLKEVDKISLAGSVRRKKETIGDVDILVVSKNPQKVMDIFTELPGVIKIWGKGPTKSSVTMQGGFNVDLCVVPAESFGAALQYFTGSKEHNIEMRKIAISKGLKLNEYGVFKGDKMIAGRTENEVYNALTVPFPLPEKRG